MTQSIAANVDSASLLEEEPLEILRGLKYGYRERVCDHAGLVDNFPVQTLASGVTVMQFSIKTLGVNPLNVPRFAMAVIAEYKNNPGNGCSKA